MPQVPVIGALAQRFIAFQSLAEDMAAVVALIDALASRPTPPGQSAGGGPQGPDAAVDQAIWNAALVRYGRCFKAGRRKGFANEIPIPPGERELHEWMLALRDQHVAHLDRETLTEQSRVFLLLNALGPRQVAGVGVFNVHMALAEPEKVAACRHLADQMRAAFTAAGERAGDRIEEHGKQLPVDDLYRAALAGQAIRLDDEPSPARR